MKQPDFKKDLEKLKPLLSEKIFAYEVYSSLCNMQWKSLTCPNCIYSCSWRFAGGLVASLREQGENYLDFYCSGGEGTVSKRVEEEFRKLGWKKCPWEEENEDN